MSQSNFVELARCGDPHAISALITRALRPQKITACASSYGSQLKVLLEAEVVPTQEVLVRYIYQGITKLNIPLYESLVIYGRRIGEDQPNWEQEFSLVLQDESLLPESSEAKSVSEKSPLNHSSSELSRVAFVGQKQQRYQAENPDKKSDNNLSKSSIHKDSIGSSEKLIRSVKLLQKISLIIFVLLWVTICFDALFLLYSLAWAISDGLYTILEIVDTTGLFSSLIHPVFRFMYMFWEACESTDRVISHINGFGLLVWLYCLHRVLKWSFKNYPITPWGAIARHAIPFYNIWGIWNIFSTLANHLTRNRNRAVTDWGEKLKRWFPLLYAGLILSILAHVVYRLVVASVEGRSHALWWFYVGFNIVSLANSILYLQVVRISYKAVSEQGFQGCIPHLQD